MTATLLGDQETQPGRLADADASEEAGESRAAAGYRVSDAGRDTVAPQFYAAEHAIRTWTDATGTRRIEAKFLRLEDRAVVVETTDGRTGKLPWDRLSSADRDYVASVITATHAGDEDNGQQASRVLDARQAAGAHLPSGEHSAKDTGVEENGGQIERQAEGPLPAGQGRSAPDFQRPFAFASFGADAYSWAIGLGVGLTAVSLLLFLWRILARSSCRKSPGVEGVGWFTLARQRKYLRRLKRGAATWNKYMEKSKLKEADLRGISLVDTDLRGIKLVGARLQGATFRDCNLENAQLDRANLTGTTFRNVCLKGASLVECVVDDSRFNDCDLTRCDLHAVVASNRCCNFSNANLTNADMKIAALPRARFLNTNLTAADLSRADLSFAEFRDARLDNALLSESHCNSASFVRTSFKGARLLHTELANVKMLAIDFQGATIQLDSRDIVGLTVNREPVRKSTDILAYCQRKETTNRDWEKRLDDLLSQSRRLNPMRQSLSAATKSPEEMLLELVRPTKDEPSEPIIQDLLSTREATAHSLAVVLDLLIDRNHPFHRTLSGELNIRGVSVLLDIAERLRSNDRKILRALGNWAQLLATCGPEGFRARVMAKSAIDKLIRIDAPLVSSKFAGKVRCEGCREVHAATEWPERGDQVPYYIQREQGIYDIAITCPKSNRKWHIVWDEFPGLIGSVQHEKPVPSFGGPIESTEFVRRVREEHAKGVGIFASALAAAMVRCNQCRSSQYVEGCVRFDSLNDMTILECPSCGSKWAQLKTKH